MTYEFEGKNEQEVIDAACAELGLERDQFEVEILESQKGGFLKRSFVRAKITVEDSATSKPAPSMAIAAPEAQNDFERDLANFLATLIEKMGYSAKLEFMFRDDRKLGIKIISDNSPVLIGRKGKNLDAIQFLTNLFAVKLGRSNVKIIVDSENYRIRREESLVRLAYSVANRVQRSRKSILLEPMNPFERRLIHTTLNDIAEIETKSEGEGVFKRVRVIYKGRA